MAKFLEHCFGTACKGKKWRPELEGERKEDCGDMIFFMQQLN